MKLALYETATDFNASCRKYLLAEEAKNNMFIGSIDHAMSVYRDEAHVFGEVENQDQTVLVFMCNTKGQMFLYAPMRSTEYPVYKFLSKELCKAGVQVNGVKAEPLTADLFAAAYSGQTERESKVNMRMHILLLTKLKSIETLAFEVKKITLADDYALTREQVQFIREGSSGQEGLYFLMKDGIPVSQAAIRRKMSMGGVYTPDEHRRNGYSSALVYHLAKRILEAGNAYCIVHTDADHEISNQMYMNMGFEHIADMTDIAFGQQHK